MLRLQYVEKQMDMVNTTEEKNPKKRRVTRTSVPNVIRKNVDKEKRNVSAIYSLQYF